MAQSIKLDNNIYWDTSGIHGAEMWQELDSIVNETKTFNVPSGYRGIVAVMGVGGSTGAIYLVYCLASGSMRVTPFTQGSNLTYTISTNQIAITSTSTTSGAIWAIGNKKLTLIS